MDQAQNIQDVLERSGLSFSRLCEMMGNEIASTALFALSDDDHDKYHKLFVAFDNSRWKSGREKGAALEDLASFLLSKLGLYHILRNKRTSTNELDVVLTKKLELSSLDNGSFPPRVICECKNYGDSISVTYVGKFYSLLKVSSVKLGLMISDTSISGRAKWLDGCGLCKKIALRDDTLIINISYDDLKLIDTTNVSLLQLIQKKIDELRLDIAISYEEHELCSDTAFLASN